MSSLRLGAFLALWLFLSPKAFSQTKASDFRDTLRLDQVQFKATHNSYKLSHTPQAQIDNYDVWEIELDFGMVDDSRNFFVGHDAPEPKHDLTTLGDWVRNVLKAESLRRHPLILKLEAKTTGLCMPSRFQTFTCVDNWPETWQAMLVDSLTEWIGEENWITYREYRNELKGKWPAVSDMAGKVIVTLQDSNKDRDINRSSGFFFIRQIDGLGTVWPPIKNEADFRKALDSGANRLTMDEAYKTAWTNQ